MSDVKMYGFCFKWKIENFSFCHHDSIVSPCFADENISQMPWQLVLYPKCGKPSDDELIRCELCTYEEEKKIVINFKIEIIGPTGQILGAYEEKDATFDEDNLAKGSSLVERAHIVRDILETKKDIVTVCCHLSSLNSLDCIARTKIIVNHQSLQLRWTKDYELKSLLDMENEDITSKSIYCPDTTEFDVHFYKVKDDVEISVIRFQTDSRQCAECKISLLDCKGYPVLSISDRYIFSKSKNLWKLPSSLPISELKYNQSKYMKNGSLIILCDLFCSGGIESQAVIYSSGKKLPSTCINDTVITRHNLQSDIRHLFSDEIFCDVKLRVNDEIVQSHKSILAARSPVFYAMFQQDMLETQTGIVDIQDVDIATLKAFIKFIYYDNVEQMDYDCAKNLLIVAEKYQVLRLKEICASFLKSDISEKNACEIAALADMVTHTDLKSFALEFITDHSKDILSMPEWLSWMKNHMELATEIFQRFSENHILF